MNPTKIEHSNNGWVRIWRHDGCTCYVYYREAFDDYIGTVEYDNHDYVTVYPNSDLEIVIKNTEHWAEEGF